MPIIKLAMNCSKAVIACMTKTLKTLKQERKGIVKERCHRYGVGKVGPKRNVPFTDVSRI